MTDPNLPETAVSEKLREYFHRRLESLGGCHHFGDRMTDACEAMAEAFLVSPEFAAIADELRREAVEAAKDVIDDLPVGKGSPHFVYGYECGNADAARSLREYAADTYPTEES